MSYILDALKKADRHRHPMAVPTLGTVHRTPEPARDRRIWPWIAAAVVVVNVGAWFWLFRAPSVPDATPPGIAQTPVTTAEPSAPAPAVAPPRGVESPSVPPRSDKVVGSVPTPPSSPPESSVPAIVSRRQPAMVAPPPTEPRAAASANARVQAGNQESVKRGPADARADRPTPTDPAGVVSPAEERRRTASVGNPPANPVSERQRGRTAPPIDPQPGPSPERERGRTAPPIDKAREAPPAPAKPAERAAASASQDAPIPGEVFAKIHLQMLVYSDVPAERLVFINNQKYVEGQRIDANLVVESITQDSAVLSYQGKRLVLRSDHSPGR